MNRRNTLCPWCLKACKRAWIRPGKEKTWNYKCGNCGKEVMVISYTARVPKQNAKKKEWVQLAQALPHIRLTAPVGSKLLNLITL